jgi:hypothetical protein
VLDDLADLDAVDRDRVGWWLVASDLLGHRLRRLLDSKTSIEVPVSPLMRTQCAVTNPGACETRGMTCSRRNVLPFSTS